MLKSSVGYENLHSNSPSHDKQTLKISQNKLLKKHKVHVLRRGANGYFFVKLDFEIAVDQQTKTSDRTFEGVPDPNRQTVPAGQPRPYLVQIRPNLAKYPEHAPYPYFICSSCS